MSTRREFITLGGAEGVVTVSKASVATRVSPKP
jgi:hypothetical protein